MIPSRSPVAIRLGKLAEAGRTGSLHLSGDSGGVIYVSAGAIVAAESRRTPSLAGRMGTEEAGPVERGTGSVERGTGSVERSWLATEATIDAVMELMSARPRHVRFTEPGEEPGPDLPDGAAVPGGAGRPGPPWLPDAPGLPLTTLMAEVNRRHNLLEQIADVLTPDAAVARKLRLRSRAVRLTDGQWAILLQLGRPVTPRTLALGLGQSVFGTTIEVYRMVIMDLVSVIDAPARAADPAVVVAAGPAAAVDWAGEASRGRSALSFIRALA